MAIDSVIVNQALSQLVSVTSSTTNFVSDQAPVVCQEILNYMFWKNAISLICCVIFAILSCCYFYYYYKNYDDKHFKIIDLIFIISFIVFIVCFISIFTLTADLIKISFAPRLFLIEFLKNLLK